MNKAIRKLVLFFYRLFKMSEEIQFIPDSKIIYYDEVSPLSESRNWGLDLCEIDEAWRLTKGAGIKVAILDTGICKHEDLDGAWSENLVFNCSQDDNWEDKQSSHGTHVAGIVGARANNVGVVGIAPECTIIPIKVLNNNGGGRYSNIIDGIRLAISPQVDADIITMSLGASSPGPSELHDIIKEATSKGKIILAAAGNDSGPVNYPACYDEVIAVAAVDEHGDFAKFTSSGAQIDSLGPGVNIYSTLIGNKYGLMSGTSQACPFIAGLCALILAYTRSNPDKPQIKNYEDMMVALAKLSDETKYVKMEGEKRWGFGLPKLANRNLETLLQGQ